MTAWLLDTLLYTGLLIALVLVLRRPVGRWFGPQLAYALWALPLLRLLLPPIVLPASFAPAAVSEAAPPVAEAAAEPATQWIAAAQAATVEPATLAAAAPNAAPAWQWAELAPIALSIWLGVALAFLAWRVVTYRRMRRELLAEARPVGEVGRIRLVETPALAAPVAFGVRDKVVALPPLFMAQPDLAARDLAIAHELAHHRGHDLLANYAAQVLLALHWFNPLAWLGWRAMRRDQEAACDARVLAGRGRDERALYAALIVDIAAGPQLALAAPMACPVLGEKSIIHRLRSLSMAETTPARRRLGRALLAAGVLALPATASFTYAAASARVPEPAASSSPAPSDQVQTLALPARTQAAGAPEAPGAELARLQASGASEPTAAPRPPRAPESEWQGDPHSPEFEVRIENLGRDWEQFGRDMEKWGEELGERLGEQMAEQWSEKTRAQVLAQAERQRAQADQQRTQALAQAERQRTLALAQAERQRAQAMAQAERQRAKATAGLRSARAAIAHNGAISDDVRREILEDLDREIVRIERGDH